MTINTRCYCGCKSNSEIYHDDQYILCQCTNCGQAYVIIQNKEVFVQEYDDSEYFIEKNQYLVKWKELSVRFQYIIDEVKKYKSGGSLLDVGCSVGIFLDVARRNGYEAEGVEISKWASDFARSNGFKVFNGGLAEAAYPSHRFDVIIMNHVLEHISDPVEALQEVNRILKDDGVLIIGVPNYGSLMSKLKKENWISLLPEQHIWQFTHKTLENLLKLNGFKEVYFEARENHKVTGLGPKSMIRRIINLVSYISNNSEAMMLFARKQS